MAARTESSGGILSTAQNVSEVNRLRKFCVNLGYKVSNRNLRKRPIQQILEKTVVMFMSEESIVCGANLDSDVMLKKKVLPVSRDLLKSFSPNTDPIQLR